VRLHVRTKFRKQGAQRACTLGHACAPDAWFEAEHASRCGIERQSRPESQGSDQRGEFRKRIRACQERRCVTKRGHAVT
jgi:hypothetical protein